MKIKEFYYNINQSNDQNLQFKRWKNFREEKYNRMKNHIINKDIIILGAGNCNDLDLKSIKSNVKGLTLADIDSTSIREGIKRHNLLESEIKIIENDFTGLGNNFYITFKKMVDNRENPDTIFNKLSEIISDIDPKKIINKKYDVVVSTPIYSQLVYPTLISIIDQSNYREDKKLRRKILDLMPSIIGNFNDFMLSISKDGAKIIVWADLMEFRTNDKIDKNNLANIYTNYIREYGIGIPGFGLIDIVEKIEIIENFWDIWPFSSEKKYLVKGIIGIKN